jgi:hypothetical protein
MYEASLVETMLIYTFGIFFAVLFIVFLTWVWKVHGPGSAIFSTANAGSNFARKIRYHLDQDISITMPMGKGLYPLNLCDEKRERWESKFFFWSSNDISLTAVLCDPESHVLKYWKDLSKRVGENLDLRVLSSDTMNEEDAKEASRLINFHTVLVYKNNRPFAMWIEKHHPTGSTKAYNVEYIAPRDLNEFQIKRFEQYSSVINRLIALKNNDYKKTMKVA